MHYGNIPLLEQKLKEVVTKHSISCPYVPHNFIQQMFSLQSCSNIQDIGGWQAAFSFSETRNNAT